jgi:hypothetical protein
LGCSRLDCGKVAGRHLIRSRTTGDICWWPFIAFASGFPLVGYRT